MSYRSPVVSILICVHNEPSAYINKALESLCIQCYSDFEIVLIDDGSTSKETVDALFQWKTKDDRLHLYREPSRGLTRSLNIGLNYCRGDLIARHDADDWSEPARLANQVSFLQNHPEIGLVGSQIMLHMENGKALWPSRLPRMHSDITDAFPTMNPFCHGATMYRRSLVLRAGGYRESLPCSQDYDLFWRLSEHTQTANLPEVLYHHRRRGGSISAQRAVEQTRVASITRALACMRKEGVESFPKAEAQADLMLQSINCTQLAMRKHADNLMLGGDIGRSIKAYTVLILKFPLEFNSYASFVRCIFFFLAFPFRRYLFRS